MTARRARMIWAGLLCGSVLCASVVRAPAQPPVPAPVGPGAVPAPDPDAGVEVLARGPVHEAYAAAHDDQPAATPVVPRAPPDPVEELPPDQKPAGDNVQWISGYWHWDEDRADFIWVSGSWRVPPPNRVWVAGNWRAVRGGWQWGPGFWQDSPPAQAGRPQPAPPEIEYLPQPPATIEAGPAVPAPDDAGVYVPGTWAWRGHYLWRPGFWIGHRPDWVWTLARYVWTPAGFVFVDGYWDYPLATRGVLFAPVYFDRRVYARPAFVYTPAYVVSEPCMVGALFARRGHGGYYFGDYFEPRYGTAGYTPWCGPGVRAGGGARAWSYDPLWSYYSAIHRRTPGWGAGVTDLYAGRYRGDVPRPPRTLAQQNVALATAANVSNVTNVTSTLTVANNGLTLNNTNVTSVAMVAPLAVASRLQPAARIGPLPAAGRREEQAHARQVREVGVSRARAEAALAGPGTAPTRPNPPGAAASPVPTARPVRVKLEVPEAVAARAQVKDEKHAPPPPAHPKVEAKSPPPPVTPKVNPLPAPKIDPKPPVHPLPPVTPPKVEPKTLPKAEPKNPPVNPLPPANPPKGTPPVPPANPPKVEPKTPPKVEPKVPPVPPKVDPKPPVHPVPPPPATPPPKAQPPKAEPRPALPPQAPKADPHPMPPQPPKGTVPPGLSPPHPAPPPRPTGVPPPGGTPPKDRHDTAAAGVGQTIELENVIGIGRMAREPAVTAD